MTYISFDIFLFVLSIFILFFLGFSIRYYITIENQGYRKENRVTAIFGLFSLLIGFILGFTGPLIAFNPINFLNPLDKIYLSLNLAGFGIALISIGFALLTYAENREVVNQIFEEYLPTALMRDQQFNNFRINRIFRR